MGTDARFVLVKKICCHNNLTITKSYLFIEWSQKNKLPPELYSVNSHVKVWWKCQKDPCGCHEWEAPIYSRSQNHGCPFCYGKACKHNNLSIRRPDISKEWHPKNKFPPEIFPVSSGRKVWWKCLKKGHEWEAYIYNRLKGTGCPHCSTSGYSKAQIKWLKGIEEEKGIKIRHAESPEGEYRIPGIGKVDGYDAETKTVYEFHGDYWHGNPALLKAYDWNLVSKKTFRELYEKTIERDAKIIEAGYRLVVEWETPFDESDVTEPDYEGIETLFL